MAYKTEKLTLQQRVTGSIVVTALCAFLGLLLVMVPLNSQRIRDSATQAGISAVHALSGDLAQVALFGSAEVASDLVSKLSQLDNIQYLYLNDTNQKRTFTHLYADRHAKAPGASANISTSDKLYHVTVPVRYMGEYFGSVSIGVSKTLAPRDIYMYWALVLGLLGIILATAWFLASKLRDFITGPIDDLNQFLEVVNDEAAFSNRISAPVREEIGLLYYRVNNLLDSVQRSRQHLAAQEYALDKSAIVSITNTDGAITYVNDLFCAASGYSRDELLGENHRIINSGFHDDEFFENLWRTLSTGSVWQGEICDRSKDDRIYWVYSTIVPLLDEKGKFTRLHAISFDITDRKQAEAALKLSKDESEAANRAKSRFITSMSHELRTPLNAIIGFSQLFQLDPNLGEQLRVNASDINRAGMHLLDLINDILDMEKIESGEVEISLEVIDPMAVVREALTMTAELAASKKVSVEIEGIDYVGGVYADYTRLKQILVNLLTNAIKYNRESGQVRLGVHAQDDGFVRFSVTDTGNGIDSSRLSGLFEPFNRLGAEASDIEGTGIGLSITKQLVEKMGGHIAFNSEPGKGSHFWFDLPSTQMGNKGEYGLRDNDQLTFESAIRSEPDHESPASPEILIAEDNPANQMLFIQQLNLCGYQADIVANGAEAFAAWQKGSYKLILTDYHMPIMDGFELARKIRKMEHPGDARIPIIAITASSVQTDADKSCSACIDDFLYKPIDIVALKVMLKKWLPADDGSAQEAVFDEPIKPRTSLTDKDIDLSVMQTYVGDNPATRQKLLGYFIASAPQIIDALSEACQSKNNDQVTDLVHKLKSSFRAFGANALTRKALSIEASVSGNDWCTANTDCSAMQELMQSFIAYVRQEPDSKQGAEKKSGATGIADDPSGLRILLLDDDEFIHQQMAVHFSDLGITDIQGASNGFDALKILQPVDCGIDVLICDLRMPGMDGISFLRFLAEQGFSGSLIIMSGQDARLMKQIRSLAEGRDFRVIGVLEKPVTRDALNAALRKANRSQQAGRHVRALNAKLSVEELRFGIITRQVTPYYQPQVDRETGELVGIEALARWNSPEHGLLGPDDFLPSVQSFGLINDLTDSMFRQAVKQLGEWSEAGLPQIDVSINFSMACFEQLDLPERLTEIANDAGVAPERIILEITEAELANDQIAVLDVLTRLRLKGFSLSIDDFGTGWSTMAQLHNLPFCELKIDRAYVRNIDSDAEVYSFAQSGIQLAKDLGLQTVAEGVERYAEWETLAELGVDRIQGFLVAEPMAASQFIAWAETWDKSAIADLAHKIVGK